MRTAALVIAALLAVPACIALLRPRRSAGDANEPGGRVLDVVWTVVPFALLVVLAAFAAAA